MPPLTAGASRCVCPHTPLMLLDCTTSGGGLSMLKVNSVWITWPAHSTSCWMVNTMVSGPSGSMGTSKVKVMVSMPSGKMSWLGKMML